MTLPRCFSVPPLSVRAERRLGIDGKVERQTDRIADIRRYDTVFSVSRARARA